MLSLVFVAGSGYPVSSQKLHCVATDLRQYPLCEKNVRGGEPQEQAKSGMAEFGTTKVCQIMPRYLKVRGHFSGCHCERSGPERFQCAQQPNSLREIRRTIQATVQKPTRNDSNQPKAHRQQRLPFTVYACSCATIWGFVPNSAAIFKDWRQIFSAPIFRQISHAPNFPLPGTGHERFRAIPRRTCPSCRGAAGICFGLLAGQSDTGDGALCAACCLACAGAQARAPDMVHSQWAGPPVSPSWVAVSFLPVAVMGLGDPCLGSPLHQTVGAKQKRVRAPGNKQPHATVYFLTIGCVAGPCEQARWPLRHHSSRECLRSQFASKDTAEPVRMSFLLVVEGGEGPAPILFGGAG